MFIEVSREEFIHIIAALESSARLSEISGYSDCNECARLYRKLYPNSPTQVGVPNAA